MFRAGGNCFVTLHRFIFMSDTTWNDTFFLIETYWRVNLYYLDSLYRAFKVIVKLFPHKIINQSLVHKQSIDHLTFQAERRLAFVCGDGSFQPLEQPQRSTRERSDKWTPVIFGKNLWCEDWNRSSALCYDNLQAGLSKRFHTFAGRIKAIKEFHLPTWNVDCPQRLRNDSETKSNKHFWT